MKKKKPTIDNKPNKGEGRGEDRGEPGRDQGETITQPVADASTDANPKPTETTGEDGQGDVTNSSSSEDLPDSGTSRTREGHNQADKRWIREGIKNEVDAFRDGIRAEERAKGASQSAARETAWLKAKIMFPPPDVEPEPEPEPAKTSTHARFDDPEPEGDNVVTGLSDLPKDWPEMPGNANLQDEVKWVSANRLRVRTGPQSVDLSHSLTPAVSYGCLAWLETAILYPSKFADIHLKCVAQSEDSAGMAKRERRKISEVRDVLDGMIARKD